MAVTEAYKTVCDIGEKGCGKTTYELGDEKLGIPSHILQHCAKHNMKVLFIDNWKARAGYEKIKLLHYNEANPNDPWNFKNWTRGARRIIVTSEQRNEIAAQIYKHVRKTVVCVEDSRMIVPSNITGTAWEDLLVSNKNITCSLIFMYHSYKKIPPAMYDYIDEFEIFKTKSHPLSRKNEIAIYELVLEAYNRVMDSPNPFYHETVKNGS